VGGGRMLVGPSRALVCLADQLASVWRRHEPRLPGDDTLNTPDRRASAGQPCATTRARAPAT
jgi:hypothetical protein